MVQVGNSVTVKKLTTGQTMTGKVSRVETKVKLDKPIIIEAAGYNDIISEVTIPGNYEIVSVGGKRKTRKSKKGRKTRRRR